MSRSTRHLVSNTVSRWRHDSIIAARELAISLQENALSELETVQRESLMVAADEELAMLQASKEPNPNPNSNPNP